MDTRTRRWTAFRFSDLGDDGPGPRPRAACQLMELVSTSRRPRLCSGVASRNPSEDQPHPVCDIRDDSAHQSPHTGNHHASALVSRS